MDLFQRLERRSGWRPKRSEARTGSKPQAVRKSEAPKAAAGGSSNAGGANAQRSEPPKPDGAEGGAAMTDFISRLADHLSAPFSCSAWLTTATGALIAVLSARLIRSVCGLASAASAWPGFIIFSTARSWR